MMIKVEKINKFSSIIKKDWDELLDKVTQPTIFMEFNYLESWWKYLASKEEKLYVLLAKEGDRLIGIAPLSCDGYQLSLEKSLKFIGIRHADYCNFIIESGREKEILKVFLSYLKHEGINKLYLDHFPKDSKTYQIITRWLRTNKIVGSDAIEEVAPYLNLTSKRKLISSMMKEVAYQQRRLKKLGSIKLKLGNNLFTAKEYLKKLIVFHLKRKTHVAANYFKNYNIQAFYRILLQDFYKKGQINVAALTLNNKIIACAYLLVYKNRLLYYTPAYDQRFARYSPGMILINELIKYAIKNNYKEFDFGYGDEFYKYRWTHKEHQLRKVQLFLSNQSACKSSNNNKWQRWLEKIIFEPKKGLKEFSLRGMRRIRRQLNALKYGKAVIVSYPGIFITQKKAPIVISPDCFKKQIKLISKYFPIISLRDLINGLEKKKFPYFKQVVITFDDVCANHYNNVYPVLRKSNIKATFFLNVSYMGIKRFHWQYLVALLLQQKNGLPFLEKILKRSLKQEKNETGADWQRCLFRYIENAIKNQQSLLKSIEKIGRIIPPKDMARCFSLSLKQLNKISNNLINIGIQGTDYIDPTILKPKKIVDGIKQVKADYWKYFFEKDLFFSYPHDFFNEDLIKIIKKEGFKCGLTSEAGSVLIGDNPWKLNRLIVTDPNKIDLIQKLNQIFSTTNNLW